MTERAGVVAVAGERADRGKGDPQDHRQRLRRQQRAAHPARQRRRPDEGNSPSHQREDERRRADDLDQ